MDLREELEETEPHREPRVLSSRGFGGTNLNLRW